MSPLGYCGIVINRYIWKNASKFVNRFNIDVDIYHDILIIKYRYFIDILKLQLFQISNIASSKYQILIWWRLLILLYWYLILVLLISIYVFIIDINFLYWYSIFNIYVLYFISVFFVSIFFILIFDIDISKMLAYVKYWFDSIYWIDIAICLSAIYRIILTCSRLYWNGLHLLSSTPSTAR